MGSGSPPRADRERRPRPGAPGADFPGKAEPSPNQSEQGDVPAWAWPAEQEAEPGLVRPKRSAGPKRPSVLT